MEVLPTGPTPDALTFPHFPTRMHAFIWRNWPVVEVERLADVLGTSAANVREVAESMGLPEQQSIAVKDRNRIYITLIRRNWHLLPYEQLLTLLKMSEEQLAYALREDDFLYIKLGSLKPMCEPLHYSPPDEETKKRCAKIRRMVQESFGEELQKPEEARFHFIDELSRADPSFTPDSSVKPRFSPRYIYSYFAIFGDPLLHPELDPYPDGLLQRLSALGVDGVWMHTVLRQLAPSELFPEFGVDHEIRLQNLRNLVARAKKYGMGIYLYMNEPRAMPESFFARRPEMKGVQGGDFFTMCTSHPAVRQWLTDSLAYVFEQVPGLAGVFTITASENLTSCASHHQHTRCPRCKDRSAADIIAEVNQAIEAGVHRGDPDAEVIAWDWGWRDDWAADIIRNLPKSVSFMSVSEWSKPITRGGIESTVGEYSISTVGPGPRATKHWALAKQAGLRTLAKMQINITWELSAVPYLPVLDLIAEHCENMLSADINGMMLSWSLGGYPSPNLELIRKFDREPAPSREAALDELALSCFGPDGASYGRKAWTAFSHAFREYPYNAGVIYQCPAQYGPSNLLYDVPTKYKATMVGFPYDDVDGWRGPYPADVFAGQFEKVASGWQEGLQDLEMAVERAPAAQKKSANDQLRFARAAWHHFRTIANQTRFTVLRNELWHQEQAKSESERRDRIETMKKIIRDEIAIARELYSLIREDSRIGYEASNHYYYLPVDLMEKVINCQYISESL
jgi:phage gp37-like protein